MAPSSSEELNGGKGPSFTMTAAIPTKVGTDRMYCIQLQHALVYT